MGPRGGKGLSLGDLVSGLGAVVLLVSLWRPWYELRFPDEVLAQARQFTSRMGELAPFAQQGIDELQTRGSVPITAWQAFEQADTLLAVAAGAVLGLVLLNATGALAARLDGVLVLAGLVATGLVAFRLVSPPGPDIAAGGRPVPPHHRRLRRRWLVGAADGRRRHRGPEASDATATAPHRPRVDAAAGGGAAGQGLGTRPRRPARSARRPGCPTRSTSRRSS